MKRSKPVDSDILLQNLVKSNLPTLQLFLQFLYFFLFQLLFHQKLKCLDLEIQMLLFIKLRVIKYNLNIVQKVKSYKIKALRIMNSSKSTIKQSKETKPQISIQSIKDTVKKFKNQGFQSLTHHDLAIALSTVGFSEVCKQFGAVWNIKCEKQAQVILNDSDYDLSWYGKVNNLRFSNFLIHCSRGDIQKIKQTISSLNSQSKKELFTTVDNFKRNGLHIAVKQGYDVLAQYLINQGISLNSRDRQLKTPLHYCRDQLICHVLLKKKAKVIVKDNKYCTPVHYIASGGDYKCLQLLLKSANIVNQKDSTGKSPIFYSVYNTSQQQINIIRVLLQNGAKVNEQDIYGKTPLHYAVEIGKSRCIPILLRKGASFDIRDKHNKTALDLAEGNQKIKKMLMAYGKNNGVIFQEEEQQKRKQLKLIEENNKNRSEVKYLQREDSKPKIKINNISSINLKQAQSQIYTKQINQVSTWVRQKFFVLMKKLQQSGIKAMWHLKRPYVYTGSWAEDVDGLQDLYETFLNVTGPEAAMRTFNLLCPYEKNLPSVIGKSQQAFQSFFGENWFSNDPVQKVRNLHAASRIRNQLQMKVKQAEDLKTELLGYKSEIETLQSKIMNLNDQLNHYKRIEQELRREKNKNTHQYTEILRLMSQNEELKTEINNMVGGQQKTKVLSALVEDLKSKNSDLQKEIENIKVIEAAARRKCGQIFLKGLSVAQNSEQLPVLQQDNLYDDDAIISLHNLLKNNPPNLEKRFKLADKRGNNKLTIDQFTKMLEDVSMLPQDVMSMHRITGFALGRKTLSLQQFKTILENRHKNRPMWEKKLIRKIKQIIISTGIKLQNFFQLIDKDGNGTIQASELRKGLEQYNIFMNQTDWSNFFNLLDSDNSGEIDLNQLKTLMQLQRTGKLDSVSKLDNKNQQQEQRKIQIPENQDNKQGQQEQQKEKNQDEEKNNNEENKYEQEQEYQEPYVEKDSEQDLGLIQLNGTLKVGIFQLKINLPDDQQLEKAYVKFYINDDVDFSDAIKMADLSLNKLSIKTQLKLIRYKIQSYENFKLNISVWKSRQMNEDTYLGETDIDIQKVMEKQKGIILQRVRLVAQQYEKEVDTQLSGRVAWYPSEQQ